MLFPAKFVVSLIMFLNILDSIYMIQLMKVDTADKKQFYAMLFNWLF